MSHTPDLDKIKKMLLKVKELADRGESGEREAAQWKLTTLLEKYGIDISEIEAEKPAERDIKHYKGEEGRMVLLQVIVSVANDASIFITKNKSLAHVKLTYNEYIEVLEKYQYYWGLYKEQKNIFQKAFITRNNLYATKTKQCKNNIQQSEEAQEVAKMMMSMKKGVFGEQVETKYIE